MVSGSGENVAMAIVELDDWDKRTTEELSLSSIVRRIQEGAKSIPEANIMAFTPPAIMGLGVTGGISFSLTASGEVSTKEIMENAKKLAAEISTFEGVTTAMNSNSGEIPQFSVQIDREKAESLGIPVSSIFSTLQSNIASYYINDFNILGDVFEVNMQAERNMHSTLEDLMELQIPTPDGEMTPLSTVASAKYGSAPKQINMYNKLLSTDINVMTDSSVSTGEIMDKIENIKLPFGYDIAWTDMSYQEKQNENKIVSLMALAIVFAYLFLVAQYESWTIPVPIMMTVATDTRRACGAADYRGIVQHLRPAWHGYARRANCEKCDSYGRIFKAGARDGRADIQCCGKRCVPAVQGCHDDGAFICVRRATARSRDWSRGGEQARYRHYDIFGNAHGNVPWDHLDSVPIRACADYKGILQR